MKKELVIELCDGADPKTIERMIGYSLKKNSPVGKLYTATVDDDREQAVMTSLRSSPLVEVVETNSQSFSIMGQ